MFFPFDIFYLLLKKYPTHTVIEPLTHLPGLSRAGPPAAFGEEAEGRLEPSHTAPPGGAGQHAGSRRPRYR